MASKISNWLLMQDEKFLSMIKDEGERTKQLNQLYKFRVTCVFLLFFLAIVFIIEVVITLFGASDTAMVLSLFLLIGPMLSYVETDSRIKTIRLYESLLAADQKS